MNRTIIFHILFQFLLLSGVVQAQSIRNIYVSPNGTGTGDGSINVPISLADFNNLYSSHNAAGAVLNVYFEPGEYEIISPFKMNNAGTSNQGLTITFDKTPRAGANERVIFKGGGNNGKFIAIPPSTSQNRSTLTIKNVTIQKFQNGNNAGGLFYFKENNQYATLNLENVIVSDCGGGTTSEDNDNMFKCSTNQNGTTLSIKNSTIRNCTYRHLIYVTNASSLVEVSGTSILNSRFYYAVFRIGSNAATNIYNNTLSNNTFIEPSQANAIYANSGNVKFFNNTVYNSGRVHFQATGPLIINNLIAGTSQLSGAASYVNNAKRNTTVKDGRVIYCISGNTSGEDITPAFNRQFDTELSNTNEPGKQVHKIAATLVQNDCIHRRGGTLTTLLSELGNSSVNMTMDQLGNPRPAQEPLSIGALDALELFELNDISRSITSIYDSEGTPQTPQPVSMDLSQYISKYPSGINEIDTDFSVDATGLSNGTISYDIPLDPRYITFHPYTVDYKSSGFKVDIKATDQYGVAHSSALQINTLVYDKSRGSTTSPPPGYVDPLDYPQTCFDFMGRVDFTSDYRWTQENSNLYGFSIPLVGDLNGDGYPEVVGIRSNETAYAYGFYNGIVIYNGQTGEVISELSFQAMGLVTSDNANTSLYRHDGWHGAPSIMALVDSDRDGVVECILALPNYGKSPRTISSYNLIYDSSRGEYSAEKKWGPYQYSSNENYHKAIPQVVDLDGDGVPEVVVYNKIYNAVTGDLLLSFGGELGTGSNNAYVGADYNASYGSGGDPRVNFSYIYDMDGDGIYDIVAGGKIYLIKKGVGGFYFDTVVMEGLPDGRTGVADVTGDGRPDVVVVNAAGSVINSNLIVRVWNPSFSGSGASLRWDPKIVAQQTVGVTYRGYGNHSYVYIGDIDGRVQTYNGKEYRLPEIAILTAKVNYGLTKHPNVIGVEGEIPSSNSNTHRDGDLFALTYDPSDQQLKLSFVMEHQDDSNNTGFTMFDFDNDGIMEICYRDRTSLRIIKPTIPFVKLGTTNQNVELLNKAVKSETGFEYPVIADIDNDASAEMVVVGIYKKSTSGLYYGGGLGAIGNGDGDKFAPTRKVWNQFMYDPFKINENLMTPEGPAPNRLEYNYHKVNEDKVIEFNPYNGTLIQPTRFMLIEDNTYGKVYDPIVFLTEAYIVDNKDDNINRRPVLSGQDNDIIIEFTIGNDSTAFTDVSVLTPVAVYKNGMVSRDNYIGTWALNELHYAGTTTYVNAAVKAGNEIRVKINITGADALEDGIYIVRLGDDSKTENGIWQWKFGLNSENHGSPDPGRGIGVASRAYRDCNWDDQAVRVAKPNIFPDGATVQAAGNVEIPIFDNDILPDSFFEQFVWNESDILDEPKAGTLMIRGTGRNTKVIYQNLSTADLVHSVDSFIYRAKFIDPLINNTQLQEKTTTVYIYVLQSETGYATCSDEHLIQLKELPEENITFNWFKDDLFMFTGSSKLIEGMLADSIYLVELVVSANFAAANYRHVSFPKGELTVFRHDPSAKIKMKWTGIVDRLWTNPHNWVLVKTENSHEIELPVNFSPTSCTDVVIPSGLQNYPEMEGPAYCRHIKLENRAMIARIHHLTYETAEVELTLKPSEKERFIMWSAPMKQVYTGDYHFTGPDSNPYWGDVYMNFFQAKNPDIPDNNTNQVKRNAFTATFGSLGIQLPLGRGFNVKVDNRATDATFRFPQKASSYKDANGKIHTVFRGNDGGRFILDKRDFDVAGGLLYNVNVYNDEPGYELIQVVNPFMAYLDIDKFMNVNEELSGDYKIWNGNIDDGFVTIKRAGDDDYNEGQRYYITDPSALSGSRSPGFIPPLQSFLVMKADKNQKVQSLIFSPEWTTTVGNETGAYPLQKILPEMEQHVLRIKASAAGHENYTLLHYDDMAIMGYHSREDALKLSNPKSVIEVYTMSATREPLDFNSSNDYTRNVRLGVQMKNAGKLTLNFSGMERFRHHVFLIDHDSNEQVYDLSIQSTLDFDIEAYSTGTVIDIPNRFSLMFKYTGIDVGNDIIPDEKMEVMTKNGSLYITAGGKIIENLQIYNLWGQCIYQSQTGNTYFSIPLPPDQFYIIKGQDDYEIRIVKTIAR